MYKRGQRLRHDLDWSMGQVTARIWWLKENRYNLKMKDGSYRWFIPEGELMPW